MTNFILSVIATIIMALAAYSFGNMEQETSNQLTQDRQIEIYEQVMDDCVLNQE